MHAILGPRLPFLAPPTRLASTVPTAGVSSAAGPVSRRLHTVMETDSSASVLTGPSVWGWRPRAQRPRGWGDNHFPSV